VKKLILHGALAEEFGPEFTMSVRSVAAAIRLMEANFNGRFSKALETGWFVISTPIRPQGMCEDELQMLTSADEIHIRPVAAGELKGFLGLLGGAGAGGFLGGVFAPFGIGAGVAGAGATGGFLGLGAGGALGGFGSIILGLGFLGILMLISSALAPKNEEKGEPAERPSFLFDGPVNTNEQGVAVPIVYGRMRTGSVIIYGGLASERIIRTGDTATDADGAKFSLLTKPALKTSFGAVVV